MVAVAIAQQRLQQHGLVRPPWSNPEAVVAALGAVQAQDYVGATWALGLRLQQATAERIEQAFTAGTILRTHVLRPTWHFVTPADIRWLLALTAPRVKARLATNDRHLDLDAALIGRSSAVLATALQGGQHRTRTELGAALAAAGMAATGQRLGHLLMHAELDGIVCSGPRRGAQFTYALLEERAPQARVLPRDEALAELTRRYFTGHGPATIRDFVWWSGLTVADAKAGLAMVGSALVHEELDGQTYYAAVSRPPITTDGPTAFLLPTYDEFLVGYAGFDRARRGGRSPSQALVFDSPLVLDGEVVGSWRRTVRPDTVLIEVAPFGPVTAVAEAVIAAAAQRYGTFVGLPVRMTRVQARADGGSTAAG